MKTFRRSDARPSAQRAWPKVSLKVDVVLSWYASANTNRLSLSIYASANKRLQRHYVFQSIPSICFPSICLSSVHFPLVNSVSHDAISLYLVEGSQWNLPQIFILRVGIVEKFFKVRGQRWRTWPDHVTYSVRVIHFSCVASRLARSYNVLTVTVTVAMHWQFTYVLLSLIFDTYLFGIF